MNGEGLTLSPILCNGMILQRDTFNRIYGSDTKSKTVNVSFMDVEYTGVVNDNYEFSITLPPVTAGGPYSIIIKGSSEIVISDIFFGDVYILSGQSNMELPIRRVLEVSEKEISNTCEPLIRQYLIPATYNFKEPEQYMYPSSWKKAMGESLMEFSAAGYFFAKEIKETYQVPVGLIMTAVGGSCIETWMNPVTLRRFGDYEKLVEDFKDINYFHSYIQNQQLQASQWASHMEEEEKFINTDNYKEWSTCIVPSLVSDYGKGSFQGSVYICREIELEQEPIKAASLYMGSIIDSDRIWINGELVGQTEYRYPPRKYQVPADILKKGKNLITVRIVINNSNGGTIKNRPYCLIYDGTRINLEGEWYYRVGKKAETTMPKVLFPPLLPICFYHTVVVPLSKIAVKGVLWYQGESNTGAPDGYADKFNAFVTDWRSLFGWEVPFIYVQLTNYREPLNTTEDSGWAEIREQQRRSLSLEKVAMVVTLDIGETSDLHPQNKKEVGARLSKAARSLIYHEELVSCGPLPKTAQLEGEKVKITFNNLEDTDTESCLNHFELAGQDSIYRHALAVRKGDSVYVSQEEIKEPAFVRYAWCDDPVDINFFNGVGLPASGFRLEVKE